MLFITRNKWTLRKKIHIKIISKTTLITHLQDEWFRYRSYKTKRHTSSFVSYNDMKEQPSSPRPRFNSWISLPVSVSSHLDQWRRTAASTTVRWRHASDQWSYGVASQSQQGTEAPCVGTKVISSSENKDGGVTRRISGAMASLLIVRVSKEQRRHASEQRLSRHRRTRTVASRVGSVEQWRRFS